jgi:hypothetical protein
MEVTGPASSCALDGGSGAGYTVLASGHGGTAGANALTATAATTTTSGDLIIASFSNIYGTLSAGTSPHGFTSPTSPFQPVECYTQTSAGSIDATAGDTYSGDLYAAIQIALKP